LDQVFDYSTEADLENLKGVRAFIQDSGRTLGVAEDTLGDICLVVDEAVTNVVIHGYTGEEGTVDLWLGREGRDLVVVIRDKAAAFKANHVEIPHLDEPLAEREYGGMGVYLIRKLTDKAEFRVLPEGGNELFLRKLDVFEEA
jgi:serine/threonine-protein kinase RsbW